MRDAANTTVRGRANDIQDALSYNITLPQPYRTELIFTIQSDWAEFGLLSPCGVIIENKANPYPPLTQGSETKITWGREHSHDQRRETIR